MCILTHTHVVEMHSRVVREPLVVLGTVMLYRSSRHVERDHGGEEPING